MLDKKDDKIAKTEIVEVYIEHSDITLNTPSVGKTMSPNTSELDAEFTRDDFISTLEKIIKPTSEDDTD